MSIFLSILHVLICLLIVGIILLQAGKGADIGATLRGGSNTLFGPRGQASFLSKATIVLASLFMVTSVSLAILSKHKGGTSVVDKMGETKDFFTGNVKPAEIPPAPAKEATPPAPAN